ncbi:MAG: hypothetical protein AABY22_07355 [Nanoarchaeota archaeon]
MKDELKWYFQNNPKYAHLSENKLKKCFDDIDELFYSYHPECSKREDLIEMIVPPEPDQFTKWRIEEDIKFVKSCCGVNEDLLEK